MKEMQNKVRASLKQQDIDYRQMISGDLTEMTEEQSQSSGDENPMNWIEIENGLKKSDLWKN